jgi:hypothetical protein
MGVADEEALALLRGAGMKASATQTKSGPGPSVGLRAS